MKSIVFLCQILKNQRERVERLDVKLGDELVRNETICSDADVEIINSICDSGNIYMVKKVNPDDVEIKIVRGSDGLGDKLHVIPKRHLLSKYFKVV